MLQLITPGEGVAARTQNLKMRVPKVVLRAHPKEVQILYVDITHTHTFTVGTIEVIICAVCSEYETTAINHAWRNIY